MGGASVLTSAALHPELVDGVSSQNGVANLLEYNVDVHYVVSVQTAIKDAFGGRSNETPEQYKKRNPQAYRSRSRNSTRRSSPCRWPSRLAARTA